MSLSRKIPWFSIALLSFLVIDFILTSIHFIGFNRYADRFQSLILSNAISVKEGTYHYDGNYSPLYFWFLSLLASRGYEFFTLAKIVSLLTVLFSILISVVISYRLEKPSWKITAFWLLGNWTCLALSFHLRAEVLLLPLFVGAWYFSALGFYRPVLWLVGGTLFGTHDHVLYP